MSLIFNEQIEREYFAKLHADFEKGFQERLRMQKPFPYVKGSKLMKELNISPTYLRKLEAAGLKRVILEEGDRIVWYNLNQLTEVMDRLAV
ncbi:hypothetical protein [Lactovum odontotermitis]